MKKQSVFIMTIISLTLVLSVCFRSNQRAEASLNIKTQNTFFNIATGGTSG